MTKMEEVRIGGSRAVDIVARQWADEDQIDCFLRERRLLTPQGELFERLLAQVAPHAIGKATPDQIILFCMVLSRQARDAMMEVPMSIPIPSQDTLRRKIAKHKEKANG